MGRLDELGDAVRRLLVDDVRKVHIGDYASNPWGMEDYAEMPGLDPEAIYHITHPKAARAIIEGGVMVPNAGRQKWGASGASNSAGKVFVTARPGVERWLEVIGNQMPHLYDDPPSKLAVIQFRNPFPDFDPAELMRRYEVPSSPRQMHTHEWVPPVFQDDMGSRDGFANSFFFDGPVPVSAPPRVRRRVSKYSMLAPLAGAAAMGEGE